MNETSLKIVKDENYYAELVEGFMKDSKLTDVDPMEKKKFIMLCVVNKLNPFKDEVYAIPRKSKQLDGSYKKILTVVVNYKTYIKRAEESGLLAGWNTVIDREGEKIIGGKITIYRKDWTHPYEMTAKIEDFIANDNILWKTKPYFMLRKQLIRVGFADCFPDIDIRENVGVEASDEVDESKNDVVIPEVSKEQQEQIDFLLQYLTNEPTPNTPKNYEEAIILIKSLQMSIAKKFVKDGTIVLNLEDIDAIFVGEESDIIKTRKAAMKKLSESEKNFYFVGNIHDL